ncbi:MAG: hypothetical protein AAGA38_03630 [Pseudomonadota bacterium]
MQDFEVLLSTLENQMNDAGVPTNDVVASLRVEHTQVARTAAELADDAVKAEETDLLSAFGLDSMVVNSWPPKEVVQRLGDTIATQFDPAHVFPIP